jgi:hypothetical protein
MCGESIVETIGENRVTMSSVLAEPVMKVAPTAQAPRWVVARFADGGIGDHVSCLMGSWWYARQTGRTLVIDWRGSRFNSRRGDGRNGVGELFEIGTTLAGVPTIADDSVAQLPFSDDAYPAKWSAAHLAGVQHVGHTPEEIVAVGRLVGAGQEVPQAWVAFNQWIDPPPPRDEARRLLAELQFTAPIRVAADRWFGAHVGTRHAVAIHIRHGNGENIGWRAAYWLDPWRFTRQCLMNALTDVHRPGRHGRFGDNMPDSLVRTESLRGSELAFLRRIAQRVAVMRARLAGGGRDRAATDARSAGAAQDLPRAQRRAAARDDEAGRRRRRGAVDAAGDAGDVRGDGADAPLLGAGVHGQRFFHLLARQPRPRLRRRVAGRLVQPQARPRGGSLAAAAVARVVARLNEFSLVAS